MAETVWVLDSVYGIGREDLAKAVERLLATDNLSIQNERQVYIAMTVLESGTGSFSDALIGALGTWTGRSATLTFDRKAARLPGFQLA
ncbi:MAG TPA: hypothetical protein VG267_08685 [Terracidiphilus sp.]|jgi:predicted nucleic-acid-binding protein|nr:hypothetical protein [Terracidiphilus sp.]